MPCPKKNLLILNDKINVACLNDMGRDANLKKAAKSKTRFNNFTDDNRSWYFAVMSQKHVLYR